MIALPYDYFLIAWFVLAGASTAYLVHCHIPRHVTNKTSSRRAGEA